MHKVLMIVAAALLLVGAPVWTHADESDERPAIISFTGGNWTQAAGPNIGWAFTLDEAAEVTRLGFVDQDGDGFDSPKLVGLWQEIGPTDGFLLSSVVVGSSDPLIGNARYSTLASPILLAPNTLYVIGAFTSPGSSDLWLSAPLVVQRDPVINFLEGRSSTFALGLTFPSSSSPSTTGHFGPNMMFVVPEPASVALLLPLAGAILVRRRRR